MYATSIQTAQYQNARFHRGIAFLNLACGFGGMAIALGSAAYGMPNLLWPSLWLGMILQLAGAGVGLHFAFQFSVKSESYPMIQHGVSLAAIIGFGFLSTIMLTVYADVMLAVVSTVAGVMISVVANVFGIEASTRK